MPIATVNPATGETVKTFQALRPEEVDERLARAEEAFHEYRITDFETRAELMRTAADLLEKEEDEVAKTVTTEMGKTLASAHAEVAKCVRTMRWYADRAERLLADEYPAPSDVEDSGGAAAHVRYRPLGPVLAVMPWNFPLWQVIRFAAPALMAGNVGLLKHASNVPQTALYLGGLFHRAGFPEGCFQTLLIGSDAVEGVLRDPRVAAATVTGSAAAGGAVAAVAGQEVKKSVLELGGSDPYIVMPSADVERAAEIAVTARVQNNGQSCIAAKRFLVHTTVYEEFAHRFLAGMAALTVGDPMDDGTDVGPLATEEGRARLEEQVGEAVGAGAQLLCGGRRPTALSGGWYYEPTVLAEITPTMRVHREEVFGPVAALYRVADLDAAIVLANDSPFGLTSTAWTNDIRDQRRLTRDLETGAVYFNGMAVSHASLPFGGIKRSGYGRELAGHGIRAFCNATTVWHGCRPPARPDRPPYGRVTGPEPLHPHSG